jgi:glycosyltransferase involved in cell wall biosynthesis
MTKMITSLSVFFPTYNEEKEIKNTVTKAKKVLEKVAKKWEIIIVNDGSKDKTGEIAKGLASKDRRIKVITHNPNRGYGAAFKSGLYTSKYAWIAFTDADGQFDFSEITHFIETQRETNADCVIGYYRRRQVPFYRKINTYLWQVIVWMLFGLNVRDIDCGFKLIGKHVVDAIPKLESERGAFISSEFLINAKKKGFTILEIPVTHYPRTTGAGTGSNINVIIKSFVDLFTLWRKLR